MHLYGRSPTVQPRASFWLTERHDEDKKESSVDPRKEQMKVSLIIIVALVVVIFIVGFGCCALRSLRRRHNNPKYLPTPFLKGLWTNWSVAPRKTSYHAAGGPDPSTQTAAPDSSENNGTPLGRRRTGNAGASSRASAARRQSTRVPDRNTSVRSVMTLPPYRVDPLSSEQVIAREGERDGVDVVVEHPTEESIEEMRDNEMEAMYQIRLARRQEIADRDERRRLRAEATARNDVVALEVLRARRREASNDTLVQELRRDHERLKNERQRAVSSVSYADLGIARLDGTRIRANSQESERVGLLSDAASIAVSTASGLGHRRDRSESAISIDSNFPSPSLHQGSRASSRAESTRPSIHSRNGSWAGAQEADVGDSEMPPYSPPGYEDVPLDGAHSGTHSGATTPIAGPPPGYPGQSHTSERNATSSEGSPDEDTEGGNRSVGRAGVDGAPQLPSLRLQRVPQIVIEPLNDQSMGRTP